MILEKVITVLITYFASAEAFLPKISLFTKMEADRDHKSQLTYLV